MIKLPKFFRLAIYLIILSVFTLSLSHRPTVIKAASSNPTALQSELQKIEDELKSIRNQKDQINNKINSESKNQSKLQSDAQYLANVIKNNELQSQSLELELKKLEVETKIAEEEKGKSENTLTEIQTKLETLNNDLIYYTNLLYKISLNKPTILDKSLKFEDSIMNEEKVNSLVRMVKSDIEEVKKLEEDAKSKTEEVTAKKKSLDDLNSQKIAQAKNLQMQIDGLTWQKENKITLLEQSKKQQQTLVQQKAEVSMKIIDMEQKVASIRNALYATPITGAEVSAGQIIGFQGRSGLSCDPWDGSVKTNNWCEVYGSTGPGWYYYDPFDPKYAASGSHLHFEYYKNGYKVYPYDQLFNPNNTEFKSKPFQPFSLNNFSRGNHEGGAIDLYQYHGAPIYAVKGGTLKYFCINYPNDPKFPDPAYGAIIDHHDGTKSGYWHMQRRGAPCNY